MGTRRRGRSSKRSVTRSAAGGDAAERRSRRAGEIAAEIGMSAPAIGRHLRVLLEALVIEDERLEADARARVFRLRPQSIAAARAWLDEILAGQWPRQPPLAGISAVSG